MARGAHLVAFLSIFTLALLARLAAIGRYVTPDELNWVYRSLGLRRALLNGVWQETLQSGHPGVTTTWIGALAAQVQLLFQPSLHEQLAWIDRLQQLSTDNVEAYRQLYVFLNGGRLGVALVTSFGLVLTYFVARDLFGARLAFCGALLLALDPFFAGLSGLLHVDGLLATFSLLALLAALSATQNRRSLPYAAAAGAFSGLALLTKTPGLILLGFVPLLLVGTALVQAKSGRALSTAPVFSQLLVWALMVVAVAVLLLPALWAAPRHVLDVVFGLSSRLATDAVRPTFFLGSLALDHGPLYYPVAVLVRLSPVAFSGLLLAVWALRWKGRDTFSRATVGWLLLFALAFLIAMTLAAKKFDRYALPSLVVLVLLGAWGLEQVARHTSLGARRLWTSALLLQGAFFLTLWPHPLTAANWLLGGNTVARQVLPSGWGEDAGLAARRLTAVLEQPQEATLFSSSLAGTAPFFPGRIVRLRAPNLTRLEKDDFVLLLSDDRRISMLPQPAQPWLNVMVKGFGAATIETGIDATALALPTFQAQPLEVRFGPALRLVNAGTAFLPWPQESLLGLTWQIAHEGQLANGYRLQIALVDRAGEAWVQREYPLLNDADHAPAHWPAAPQTVFFTVQAPPTLAPGDYAWRLRLFDAPGSQQAVYDHSGAFAGTEVQVAPLVVTPPAAQPLIEAPEPVAGPGPIVGYATLPEKVTAGNPFALEIWWQVQPGQPGQKSVVVLEVGGKQSEFLLDMTGWQPGQIYRLRPRWRLPLDLTAGEHQIMLSVRDAQQQASAPAVALGDVEVEQRDRLFQLPADVTPLQVAVGELAYLQDVNVELQERALLVHVTWQARQTTFDDLTTFMHLRDGEVVIAADDRQPLPPTSVWARGEVIGETYTLPRPPAGSYMVAFGLYNAADGRRLAMRDTSGRFFADAQFVLPVEVP